ncbi:HET-domain-containing protein, partial [Rhizodiscina lignyota]
MRLLHIDDDLSRRFETFEGGTIPPYAILSHRWEADEVLFEEMADSSAKSKLGYAKIRGCARKAKRHGLDYCWVDTCCIDKRSSAELTEAINSMYQWYQNAVECYAYLSDVPEAPWQKSKWFTRGWTLQELLAPNQVLFYDKRWNKLGTKDQLAEEIAEITAIAKTALTYYHVTRLSISERMSWASRRETTRIEDTAYCLMGIFNVNMPLLYGEGSRAFIRLQEEILRQGTNDWSLFAW